MEFEEFMRLRAPALLRYAHLLCGERATAEDLVQSALASTYARWRGLPPGEADAYVRKAILNQHLRRYSRVLRRENVRSVLPERPVHDRVNDDRDLMWKALSTLPARQRAVLVLRYYEDLTEQQTAELLGIKVGTVKSAASKALAKLREHTDIRQEIRS